MDRHAREAWTATRPGRGFAVDAACIAPWVSLEFDPQGWVYTCCANQLYPLGRIGDERLSQLWAGDRAVVLREALANWDLSIGCGSCRWHLEHGRLDPDAAVYDRYRFTDPEPAGPASMTFALSNRCNLGCIMCNGELSSTLRHQAGLAPLVQRYDDQFFEDLTPFLPGLDYAKFLGGEPFLIPEHERVWRLMDDVGGPPRMQVTTNGTIWTDRVEWLINRFVVDITVSIDAATASTYERIRPGSSHEAVRANVERFRQRCGEVGSELRFCFCLMDNNWQELGGFLRWADGMEAPVSINVVSDTGLALHDLPLAQLEHISESWAAEDRSTHRPAGENAAVWDTQRSQLAAVIDERRQGVAPTPRQARPIPADLLDHEHRPRSRARGGSVIQRSDEVEVERRRLNSWCGLRGIGEVKVDADDVITDVVSEHPRLGIDGSLVGLPIGRLLDRIVETDGRTAWLLGSEEVAGTLVRTVALAASEPVRGTPGTVVRMVSIPVGSNWVVLVAEDRMHERTDIAVPSTPVRPPGARSDRRPPPVS